MDIDPERLDYIKRAVERIVAEGNYPAKVDGHHGPRRGPQGRRRRALHHPGRRRRRLAPRHRDPQEVRRRHQHRRHAQRLGHLPRPAHHPGDARHLPATWSATAPTPSCSTTPTRWPCSAGPCSARRSDQGDRPVPQRAGHGRDAGQLDRRARWTRSPTSARASTTRPGTSSTSGTARTPIPLLRKAVQAARDLQRGDRAQRDVPAPRLLRHRVQRAQLRVQLVVPQAPGPDREVLHARHRLEPRRVRLHPERLPASASTTWQGRDPEVAGRPRRRST